MTWYASWFYKSRDKSIRESRGVQDLAWPDNPSWLEAYGAKFGFLNLTRRIFRAGFGLYFGLAQLGPKSNNSL